jgi:hypothetical protein
MTPSAGDTTSAVMNAGATVGISAIALNRFAAAVMTRTKMLNNMWFLIVEQAKPEAKHTYMNERPVIAANDIVGL